MASRLLLLLCCFVYCDHRRHLWTSEGGESLKNFTIKKINKKVKPAQKYDVHYALQTDLKEQEALLNINLVVSTDKDEMVTVNAWKNTVAVRENTVSLLDPQVYVSSPLPVFLR